MRKSLASGLLIVLIIGGTAMAQGSGSSRAAGPSSGSRRTNRGVPATVRPPSVQQFAASFWKFLHNPKSPYYRWGTPGKTEHRDQPPVAPGAAGKQPHSPHRGVGQTFINSVANKQLDQIPYRSVLVREQYAPDRKTREKILVMYRSKGVDPANRDWYWIVYNPDGSLAKMAGNQGVREMAGRIESCVQCHRQAAGNDLVFLNDKPVAPPARNVPRGGSGSHR